MELRCREQGQRATRQKQGRAWLALPLLPTSSCRCLHAGFARHVLQSLHNGLHESSRRHPVHRRTREEITVSRCRWLAHTELPSAQHRVCKTQSAGQGQSMRPTSNTIYSAPEMMSRNLIEKRTEPRYALTCLRAHTELRTLRRCKWAIRPAATQKRVHILNVIKRVYCENWPKTSYGDARLQQRRVVRYT